MNLAKSIHTTLPNGYEEWSNIIQRGRQKLVLAAELLRRE
jgi:hypothetical protein